MTFEYVIDDTSTQQVRVERFTENDPKVKHALAFIKNNLAPGSTDSYTIVPVSAVHSFGGKSAAGVQGMVLFPVPSATREDDWIHDGHVMLDLRACVEDPHGNTVAAIINCGLPIPISSIPPFAPLEEPKPISTDPEDWKQPGARIGKPLESVPGHYQIIYDGKPANPGTRWTGASGAIYELVMVGSQFTMFRMPAWKRV